MPGLSKTLISLQIGRGLAAISVAMYHLSIAMGNPDFGGNGTKPYSSLASRGFLGVDFFFVLSGFIILQAHQRDIGRPDRWARFIKRRFVRIYPIYWLYLTVAVLGMAAVGSEHMRLSNPVEWFTAYGLVRISSVELPLAQAWTLFHEIVFYAIFGVLILNRRIGLAVLAVWFVGIASWYEYTVVENQTGLSTLLAAYNLNFFFGMAAFLLARRVGPRSAAAIFAIGLGLLAYALSIHGLHWPVWVQTLEGVAFALLVCGAAALESRGWLRPPVVLGVIGDASYSIYLLHEHVQSYGLRALNKVGVSPTEHTLAVFLFLLGLTVLVGYLAYLLIERPLLASLRARMESSDRRPVPIEPREGT